MRSFASAILLVAAVVSAAPIWLRAAAPDAATISQLAPDLGVSAPLQPTGNGDCFGPVVGANGKNISVPCSCPPSRDVYIAALQRDVGLGHAKNNPSVGVSFPAGATINDELGRITAAAIVLQNLDGPGKGCPFSATTLGARRAQLEALAKAGNTVAPNAPASPATQPASPAKIPTKAATSPAAAAATAAATTAAASTNTNGKATAADVARLAPDLGVKAPLPPTGAGDCIGPNKNAQGKSISVPCSCPPSRDAFIKALTRDVLAGQAVNNPTVKISFPTGDSVQDKLARINAAAVTLQNLDGPGKGCPFASTTLGAQSKALQA